MNDLISKSRLWQLKSCPKCLGDRCLEITYDGLDLVCLQCGHRTNVRSTRLRARGRPLKFKYKQQKERVIARY